MGAPARGGWTVSISLDPSARGMTVQRETGDVWLSDDIIHAFIKQTAIRVLCLSSQLRITTDDPEYTWAQPHRRQPKNVNLMSLETILTPVNVGGAHWILTHANLTSNTMTVYDSFHDPVTHIVSRHTSRPHPSLAERQWTLGQSRQCPLQTNTFDCGLFACAAALPHDQ